MPYEHLLQAPYSTYLGLEQLFNIQGDIQALNHPDEFQFRTVHLVSELWLRLVATEMTRITQALTDHDWLLTSRLLGRCITTLGLLDTQLGLLETMLVDDYNVFRSSLGAASGLQSPGYVEVRHCAKPLGAIFTAVYAQFPDDPSLFAIHEDLLRFDMAFQRFLMSHWQIARRFIGDGGAGTGGRGVDYLRHGTEWALFPTI